MAKIDLDRLISDLIDIISYVHPDDPCVNTHSLIGALKKQGLEYKDGEIQSIPLTAAQKAFIEEGLKNGSMIRKSDLA